MTGKETKLRIEPTLDEWLTAQAAIAGIAKTKYIIQVLEGHRSNNLHTDPKLSPNVFPALPIDVSFYTEVAELKARVAKLEQSTSSAIPNTIPKDIPRFEVGQVITGQSAKTYNLLWNSFEADQRINGATYYLSNKLNVICKVVGTSRSNKKKLKVLATFPGDEVDIQDDGTFLGINSRGNVSWSFKEVVEALSQLEPPLAEPTAVVEPTNDGMAVEANQVANIPSNEPVEPAPTKPTEAPPTEAVEPEPIKLSTEELLETFKPKLANPGMVNTIRNNLGAVKIDKLTKGWTAQHDPKGRVWVPTDDTRQYWVVQTVAAN